MARYPNDYSVAFRLVDVIANTVESAKDTQSLHEATHLVNLLIHLHPERRAPYAKAGYVFYCFWLLDYNPELAAKSRFYYGVYLSRISNLDSDRISIRQKFLQFDRGHL